MGNAGRFELVEPAAEGGEATVWRARDRKLRCDVAIKALHIDGSAALDDTARLHNELRALLSVGGPHVVRVVDFGIDTDRGRYWYAMEWLDGRTVRQLVEDEGPLAWYDAASVARQVCLGLRTLHAQRIVHGDIKSSNVFIAGDRVDTGLVKLIDFGIAVQGRYAHETVQATLVGMTERWAPPEALIRGHISRRSDLYQVGVLLYHMLTGQLPFGGQTIDELVESICKAPRPRPVAPSHRPEVPAELAELCVRAMAITPSDRPRSAAALAEVLGAVLTAHDRRPTRRSSHEGGAATRIVDRKLGSHDATQRAAQGHRTDLLRGEPTLRGSGSALGGEGTNVRDDGVQPGRLPWLRRLVRFLLYLFVRLPRRWARTIEEAEKVVSEEFEREGLLPPLPPRGATHERGEPTGPNREEMGGGRRGSPAGTPAATDTTATLPPPSGSIASSSASPGGASGQRTRTTRRVDGPVASGAPSTSRDAHDGPRGRNTPVTPSDGDAHARGAMQRREETPTSRRHAGRAKKGRGIFFFLFVIAIGFVAFLAGAVWMALAEQDQEAGGHRDGVSRATAGGALPVTHTSTVTAATAPGARAHQQAAPRGRWNMPFAFPGRDHLAKSLAGANAVPLTRLWEANRLQVAQRLIPYGWQWVDLESPINLASKALVYRPRMLSSVHGPGPHPMPPTLEVRFDDTGRPWRLYLRFRSHVPDLAERAERAWGPPDGYLADFDRMRCPLWHFADAVVWVRKFTRRSGRLAGLTWTALVVADPARYERNTALRTQRFAHRN